MCIIYIRTKKIKNKGDLSQMKIRGVLELTQKMALSEVAKQYLNFGEKPAREALKNASCESVRGKRGWIFVGEDETILEKEIYEFSTVKATANGRSKEAKNEITKDEKKETNKEETNEVSRKRASFDIDKKLFSELKIESIKEERNLYELVEDAIRMYLKK